MDREKQLKSYFEEIIKLIEEKKIHKIEEIYLYMPFSRDYYYQNFYKTAEFSEPIKKAIDKNKVELKLKLQTKMHSPLASPAETIFAYKLLMSEEEKEALYPELKIKKKELQLQLDKFEFEKSKLKESEMPELPTVTFPDELEP